VGTLSLNEMIDRNGLMTTGALPLPLATDPPAAAADDDECDGEDADDDVLNS